MRGSGTWMIVEEAGGRDDSASCMASKGSGRLLSVDNRPTPLKPNFSSGVDRVYALQMYGGMPGLFHSVELFLRRLRGQGTVPHKDAKDKKDTKELKDANDRSQTLPVVQVVEVIEVLSVLVILGVLYFVHG